jgi:uncharacterized membrane protein YccC
MTVPAPLPPIQSTQPSPVLTAPASSATATLAKNANERGVKANVIHGLKTAIVAAACYVVAPHLGMREGYWSAISCIIVMQTELGASLTAARDRVIGTAIGGILGWGCAVLWGGNVALYAVGVALALVICGVLGMAGAGRISGVTVSIITLLPHTGPAWLVSLHRLLGVSFGVVVGLAAALLSMKLEERYRRAAAGESAA